MAGGDAEFSLNAAVRGFHVYRTVWSPHLGQRLKTKREHENTEDCFAIAVRTHSNTYGHTGIDVGPIVGHLPRELSQILWYILLHGEACECEVTGRSSAPPFNREVWKYLAGSQYVDVRNLLLEQHNCWRRNCIPYLTYSTMYIMMFTAKLTIV